MNRIVTIEVTRTYYKTGTFELEMPDNVPLEDTLEWIENQDIHDRTEDAIAEASLNGADNDDGRYDVTKNGKNIWGGTL